MYYAHIKNNEILDVTETKYLNKDIINIEVSKEIFDFSDKYIYKDNKIILAPDYETKLKAKQNKELREKIELELEELDKKRIRAICENEMKDTQKQESWLDYYNKKAQDLRAQIRDIQ